METTDSRCTACPLHRHTSTVCLDGRGSRRATIFAVGEAPGAEEERTGQPFVGPAGQLLGDLLDQAGIDPEDVYYTNAVSCRPPKNRKPTKREMAACATWWQRRLSVVDPKFVLLLGNSALAAVLNQTAISKVRGRPQEKDGRIYFPTFHPSYALREPANRQPIVDDLRKLRRLVHHGGIPADPDISLRIVDSMELVEELLRDLYGLVSFDIETSCLYPWAERIENPHYDRPVITSLGFGTGRHQWVIPWLHFEMQPFSARQRAKILTLVERRRAMYRLVTHGGKFDLTWLSVVEGVRWYVDHDTLLGSHLNNENERHGLDVLATKYFGAMDYSIEAHLASWRKLAPYHGLDLLYTRKLLPIILGELRAQGLLPIYRDLSIPMQHLYTEAETEGIAIDTARFREVEYELRAEVREQKAALNKHGDINWGSTKQLQRVLYRRLKLPVLKRTPKGKPSTDESTLKRLEHPIVEHLLKYRRAKQQLGLFIEGWKPYLVEGRLHPNFKIHGTVTGRTSCSAPNLQQVDKSSTIRSLVIPPPGWELGEFDLSQIELRIAAELSGEPTMIHCFNNGIDIHWMTALSEISRGLAESDLVLKTGKTLSGQKLPYLDAIEAIKLAGPKKCEALDPAWKMVRFKAKAVNFGFLYGMRSAKFQTYARDEYGIKLTEDQAEESYNSYHELYRGLDPWYSRQRRQAHDHGYVVTLTGRKRRLPDAQLRHDCPEREVAFRQAVNSPVQGFANEYLFMCALQVWRLYSRRVLRIVASVHDSMLVLIRPSEVKAVVPEILEIMRKPDLVGKLGIRLRVPIEADVALGPWGSGTGLEEWCSKSVRAR